MKEAYCNYEMSMLLKEKGFNEYCSGYYKFDKSLGILSKAVINNSALDDDGIDISAPTHQMVLAWLREKHKIHIEVEVYFIHMEVEAYFWGDVTSSCEDVQSWLSKIQRIDDGKTTLLKTCLPNATYEEAVEKAIEYVLTKIL